MKSDEIASVLKHIPHKPGVYRYYGEDKELLYIGKAKDLKKRVSSYFQNRPHNQRMSMMISSIASIEYTVVDNEKESLILEANLIYNLQPRYNVLLKSDRSYLYVRITNDPIPNIILQRRKYDPKSMYFGPYTKRSGISATLRTLRSIFPYCNERFPQKKACNYVALKLCDGICIGKETKDDYQEKIIQIKLVLEGKFDKVKPFIDAKINDAVALGNYELAALWRDRWKTLTETIDDQKIILPQPIDLDIIIAVIDTSESLTGVSVQSIRDGKMHNVHSYILSGTDTDEAYPVWERFLPSHSAFTMKTPVMIQAFAGDVHKKISAVEKQALENVSNLRIYTTNVFGDNSEEISGLLRQGKENAAIYLERNKLGHRLSLFEEENLMRTLGDIRDALGLSQVPRRMECFDISHLSGTDVYGSMAVLIDGKPAKKLYRLFKTKQINDDFKNQAEVLERRLAKALQADKDSPWKLPDLFIIDGGQPQMRAVLPVYETYKRLFSEADKPFTVELCALAKPDDHVVLPYRKEAFVVQGQGHFMFQRIRDEAHRFAITRNRKTRLKKATKSDLDGIPGVGPVTKKKLLRTFGSSKRVVEALWQNPELVYEVVGSSVTKKLKTHFKIDDSLRS